MERARYLSPDQHTLLAGLSRGEPYSLFLELNLLLYAGILAFVAGLGWTVTTWSKQLGDVPSSPFSPPSSPPVFGTRFSRAPCVVCSQIAVTEPLSDYVLYLDSLVWSVELAYIENRFHLLAEQWDLYLLATAGLFFFLAYRFDNRFVLSLALVLARRMVRAHHLALASHQDATYRQYAILYSLIVGGAGAITHRRALKPHFFGTYLNIAANVLFWALLSGVFNRQSFFLWLLALLAACGASLAWGLSRRQFSFVAYAAVYGYIGSAPSSSAK